MKFFGGQINAFPEYIEDPLFTQKTRKPAEENTKVPTLCIT